MLTHEKQQAINKVFLFAQKIHNVYKIHINTKITQEFLEYINSHDNKPFVINNKSEKYFIDHINKYSLNLNTLKVELNNTNDKSAYDIELAKYILALNIVYQLSNPCIQAKISNASKSLNITGIISIIIYFIGLYFLFKKSSNIFWLLLSIILFTALLIFIKGILINHFSL